MKTISRLLVANRGEIAVRVMRTARSLGLQTVAVYSDADARAVHVIEADDAERIGPSPVLKSYLNGEKIIEVALAKGADAIHPGYGFLSENAAFAKAVSDAGLTFVGPPADAIEIMGDKAVSKRHMKAAGVPCVPGYEGEDQSDGALTATATEIGFPLMVKAAAGGGGRGMRLVTEPDELADSIRLARSEAENAFGSGELILEKAIVRPRHVELQVFADNFGNVIHLGERDCSVQRRHQKVIEEAPCPIMTPELRDRMGTAAVDAARAVNYRGAGTVEFLLDENGDFYFLEMNTRLQVEHPVTELVTGLDLVALQLRVAQEEPLGIAQEDVMLKGHAIEVRYYAEDPDQDFLPSTGPIYLWKPPEGEGLRVDAGIVTGGEVSPYYDSMVAKIIAQGATRDEARRRLIRGLENTALFGPKTNRDFLIDALHQEAFVSGAATTAFIGEVYGDAGYQSVTPGPQSLAIAATIQHRLARNAAISRAVGVAIELLDWSSAEDLESERLYPVDDQTRSISVRPVASDQYAVTVDNAAVSVEVLDFGEVRARLLVDGNVHTVQFCQQDSTTLHFSVGGQTVSVHDLSRGLSTEEHSAGGGTVVAPMHGLLLELFVSEGDEVQMGDKLAVLESMKMQHEIIAEVDGKVVSIVASPQTQVAADDLILEIEPAT